MTAKPSVRKWNVIINPVFTYIDLCVLPGAWKHRPKSMEVSLVEN